MTNVNSIQVNTEILTTNLNLTSGGKIIYSDGGGGSQLVFDNNSNTSNDYNNSFGFYCNNTGDDNKQTNPLSFNSSVFTVDVSNNDGGSHVRYHACNNNVYGLLIGHNFTGNCIFNNNILFPTTRSSDPSANSLGYVYSITSNLTTVYSNIMSINGWIQIENTSITCSANKTYLISGKWTVTTNNTSLTTIDMQLCFAKTSVYSDVENNIVDNKQVMYLSVSLLTPMVVPFNYMLNFNTQTTIYSYAYVHTIGNMSFVVNALCTPLKYTILY
jgi:hypothetical protein